LRQVLGPLLELGIGVKAFLMWCASSAEVRARGAQVLACGVEASTGLHAAGKYLLVMHTTIGQVMASPSGNSGHTKPEAVDGLQLPAPPHRHSPFMGPSWIGAAGVWPVRHSAPAGRAALRTNLLQSSSLRWSQGRVDLLPCVIQNLSNPRLLLRREVECPGQVLH
jgi:hypothetical protein